MSSPIAHNVLGNWRLFVPDKENAKRFTGTKKCGVVRRGNGFSHDLAEQNPKWPNREFCSYRLLGEVIFALFLEIIIHTIFDFQYYFYSSFVMLFIISKDKS